MSRIDANIATQISPDAARPLQAVRDGNAQAAESKRRANASDEPKRANPTADEARSAAESLQKVVEAATGRQLDFSVNDRFNELVVRFTDRQSGETIKEIPSRDLMQLRERLDDLIGLFVDKQA